jgi:hypothetical protein
MASPISYDLQGQGGGIVLTGAGTSIGDGDFRWLQVVNDTVLGNLISDNVENPGDLAGITLPAGLGIGGRFSYIDVSSGAVIAYYA